jgi:hypothetical protein
MLSSCVSAGVLLFALGAAAIAQDEDVLRRGERERTLPYQIEYDRAVRHVLSRAWRPDVVLRIVDIPPFEREWAVGLSRSSTGYSAFVTIVSPPDSIWYTLGFGAAKRNPDRSAYRRLKPILIEKPIPQKTAARVAALWRHVLTNQRNYRRDRALYLDSDVFAYYLAFAPRERVTAWMPGWGPQTLQLIEVARAVSAYAEGIDSERKLIQVIAKAEREVGIYGANGGPLFVHI